MVGEIWHSSQNRHSGINNFEAVVISVHKWNKYTSDIL